MSDALQITIDGTALREALEGESLKAQMRGFVKAAARISADHIRTEMQGRLRRQLRGGSTGLTEASITVVGDRTGWGWIVETMRDPFPMLPRWLEFGTKQGRPGSHASAPRPFFFASATLEERAHLERVAAAIQAALSEHGLGPNQAQGSYSPSPTGGGLL